MKTNKLVAAGLLALSMTMAPVASLMNAMPVMAETVSIAEGFENHSYVAYQIFTGTQGNNGVLGNVAWGSGVKSSDIVNDIKAVSDDSPLATLKTTLNGNPTDTAKAIVEFLSTGDNSADNSAASKAFAKIVDKHIDGSGKEVTTTGVELDSGYYLIKDMTSPAPTQEVVGLSILQVTGKGNITITPKNSKPTVDKQVLDTGNVDDTWGETADHDFNKPISFKLISQNLTKTAIESYDSYYLKFTDKLSSGLTFDSITSVKLGETLLTSGYVVTNPTTENGNTLTIEISNLKGLTDYSAATDINVTVQYTAHLNDNAIVSEGTGTAEMPEKIQNDNEVTLTYSNNPNSTGTGTSEPDKVYVASFKLTNKKVALTEDGTPLKDAGFELWKGNQKAVFKVLDGKAVFQRWQNNPYNDTDAEKNEVTTVTSNDSGDFSMHGLDAGVYTLKEVVTPSGYNTAPDQTITVEATHEEIDGGSNAKVTLSEGSSASTVVVNTQNGSLPETGGMGTTMIYGAGALMVAGAAVVYVTNKRTRKE